MTWIFLKIEPLEVSDPGIVGATYLHLADLAEVKVTALLQVLF